MTTPPDDGTKRGFCSEKKIIVAVVGRLTNNNMHKKAHKQKFVDF
jgi:hypothetical protein